MTQGDREYIEDSIREPFNHSVLGFTYAKGSSNRTYFVQISQKSKNLCNKYFIDLEDVEYFNKLITGANKDRAIKKEEIKAARKAKLDAKLEKLDQSFISGNFSYIEKAEGEVGEAVEDEVEVNEDLAEEVEGGRDLVDTVKDIEEREE